MAEIKHRKCNDLRRWKLEHKSGWSIRLHHWVKGDPEPYQHAHPWNFLTIILSGGYDDVGEGRAADRLRAPAFRFRPLGWRHSIINVLPRTWSIIITGPKVTKWRFWIWGSEVNRVEWDGRVCD
jgi:hypothetical protein